jgi:hypothetical protein
MLLDGTNPYVSGGPTQIVLTPEDFEFHISDTNLKAVSREADWLVLYYIGADNDLAEQLFENVRQLKSMGSSERVHVCVFFSGPWLTDSFFARLNPGCALVDDMIGRFIKVPYNNPKVMGEILSNTINLFRARRRLMVLSSHGNGWAGILRSDDLHKELCRTGRFRFPLPGLDTWEKRMSDCNNSELSRIYAHRQAMGIDQPDTRPRMLDVVALDACHMGNIEALQPFIQFANYVVASEEREADCGYPADRLLRVLLDDPDIDSETLVRRLVDLAAEAQAKRMRDAGANEDAVTQTAFALSHWDRVCAAIGRLGASLVEHMTQTGVEAVTTAVTNTYGLPLGCRDIKGFAENLQNGDLSPRVRQAAAEVSSLFEGDGFVIESRVPGGRYLPNGLSINLPDPPVFDPQYLSVMSTMPDGFAPWVHFLEVRALLSRQKDGLSPAIMDYIRDMNSTGE